MRARVRGNEAGSVLLWVMVVGLFAVGALGATTRLVPAGRKLAEQDLRTTYSMIGAESAVHYVAHKLNQFTEETDPENLEDACVKAGELECEVFVASDGEYIYVTALVGDTKRNLRAKLRDERSRPEVILDLAVFAIAGPGTEMPAIYLDGSSTIQGTVGTNAVAPSSVQLVGDPRIHGDVIVGPVTSGKPEATVSAPKRTMYGELLTLDSEREYPLPTYPEPLGDLPERPALETTSNNSPVTISASGYYPSIKVLEGWELEFNTNSVNELHIKVDRLSLTGNGKIYVTGPGRVYIHVTESLELHDKEFNAYRDSSTYGDPNKVVIYYTGSSPVSLAGNLRLAAVLYVERAPVEIAGSFGLRGSLFTGSSLVEIKGGAWTGALDYAFVYAPNAVVQLSGSGKVTGGVVGRRISLKGNSKITYTEIDIGQVPLEFGHPDDSEDGLQWHVCWEDCLSDPDYNPQANDPGMT